MTSLYTLATREQVRAELKAAENKTTQDPAVDEARHETTRRTEHELGYKGVPEVDSWDVSLSEKAHFDYYAGKLLLPGPMLSVESVTETDGTSLVVWDGQRATYEAAEVIPFPLNKPPYYALLRRNGSGGASKWGTGSGDLITVTGVWGWHPDYAHAWVTTNVTLTTEVDDSVGATQLAVTEPTIKDATGYQPAISAGNIIRALGGSEWIVVLDVSPNNLDVARAQLGTSVETIESDSALEVFRPDPMLVRACRRWATYGFTRRGKFDDNVIDGLTGQFVGLPADIPAEVKNILASLPRYVKKVGIRAI